MRDIVLQMKMLVAGIVPFDPNQLDDKDIQRGLESLPPDERRKMKRKFRKLWRRAAKKSPGGKYVMTNGKKPSRLQRGVRRGMVRRQLCDRGSDEE